MTRLALVLNNPAFFLSHRLGIALAARDAGLEVLVVAPPKPEAEAAIRGHGLGFAPWRLSRSGLGPGPELASIAALTGLYRRLRPDLVHHISQKPVLYGSVAARLAGVDRVVNAISGLGYAFVGTGLATRCLGWAMGMGHRVANRGRATRVIFQNPDDRA